MFMLTAGWKWTHAGEAAAGWGHIWDEIVLRILKLIVQLTNMSSSPHLTDKDIEYSN